MTYITITPQEFHGSIAPRGTMRHGTGAAPHQRETHVRYQFVCAHNGVPWSPIQFDPIWDEGMINIQVNLMWFVTEISWYSYKLFILGVVAWLWRLSSVHNEH
jgi:hypothetical protein